MRRNRFRCTLPSATFSPFGACRHGSFRLAQISSCDPNTAIVVRYREFGFHIRRRGNPPIAEPRRYARAATTRFTVSTRYTESSWKSLDSGSKKPSCPVVGRLLGQGWDVSARPRRLWAILMWHFFGS